MSQYHMQCIKRHTHRCHLWPFNQKKPLSYSFTDSTYDWPDTHHPVPPVTLADLQVDILNSKHLKLADGEQRKPNADAVPQSSHHGVPQHRANVFEEWPCGHEVAALEDDGWEHVEEEDIGAEHSGGLLFDWVHDGADDEADGNQEAGLRDPDGDFVINVETWREDNEKFGLIGSCADLQPQI